jgi:hypothetical protein
MTAVPADRYAPPAEGRPGFGRCVRSAARKHIALDVRVAQVPRIRTVMGHAFLMLVATLTSHRLIAVSCLGGIPSAMRSSSSITAG